MHASGKVAQDGTSAQPQQEQAQPEDTDFSAGLIKPRSKGIVERPKLLMTKWRMPANRKRMSRSKQLNYKSAIMEGLADILLSHLGSPDSIHTRLQEFVSSTVEHAKKAIEEGKKGI